MIRRASVLAITVAVVATLAGCATDDQSGTGASPIGSTAVVAESPEALRFTAPLVGGGTFDGAAMGERPVVFWFWAPT